MVAAFLRICGKTAAEEGRETLTARCWRERELRKSSCCSTDTGVQPRGAWRGHPALFVPLLMGAHGFYLLLLGTKCLFLPSVQQTLARQGADLQPRPLPSASAP